MVVFPLVALLLSAAPAEAGRLPPPPRDLYRIAWKKSLVRGEFGEYRTHEMGGAAVSPKGDLVLVGTRDGWLHALRPDGRLAWEFQAQGPFGGVPLIEGGTVYAGSHDGRLYALDLGSGALRWSYDAKEQLSTHPALVNGLVVVNSLQDTVFAVDAATGAWKWHHRRDVNTGFTVQPAASVQVLGGDVFAGYSDGTVSAIEASTGRVRWERHVAPAGRYQDVNSISVTEGRLFVAAYSGAIMALDLATGRTLWSQPYTDASRVLFNRGSVLAVTGKEVLSLSAQDGKLAWKAPLNGAPSGALRVAGRSVLVPAHDGGLRFYEAASGRLLRVLQPGSGVAATPGIGGRRTYVLSNAGTLLALDLQ
jgi:outer membrane protein assembly factor BamB